MAFVHFGGSPKPKLGINPETEIIIFLIADSESSLSIYIEKVFELFNSDQNWRSYGLCALWGVPKTENRN